MTLIADVFWKLRTLKTIVTSMPKKFFFRRSVEKEHGKYPQTLFKYEEQHLHHISWSLGSQLSYKKSILVICKISKLFPNTLSADGNYSSLMERIQRNEVRWNYLENKKHFWNFFLQFWNYGLQKTWLDQCLKTPFSKDPSKRNMVNAPKHCWNLKNSTFTIFVDH